METLYIVVLKGLRESADPQEARNKLAALFKAAPEQIAPLLARGHHVVKRGVTLAVAEQYRAAIDGAGGVCEVETVPGPLPAPASVSPPVGNPVPAQEARPVASAAAAPGRKCSKCGYHRKPEESAPDWQCPQCGVAYQHDLLVVSRASDAVVARAAHSRRGESLRRRELRVSVHLASIQVTSTAAVPAARARKRAGSMPAAKQTGSVQLFRRTALSVEGKLH